MKTKSVKQLLSNHDTDGIVDRIRESLGRPLKEPSDMGMRDEYSEEEQKSIFGGSQQQEVNHPQHQATEEEGNEDFYSQFSTRTANILRQLHINTHEGLKTLTLYNLLHTRNAGPTTARELIDFIWNRLGK